MGSIAEASNDAGTLVASRQYDAWGNLESGADQPGYAFTGREWDPETGLYYYRARYYDPKVGRFISEDPIGFLGGDNFFAYVGNRPGGTRDPLGLLPHSDLDGDDRGYSDERIVDELEKKLKDPNLKSKERDAIKRRLRELSRRPSKKQQKGKGGHHRDACESLAGDATDLLIQYLLARQRILDGLNGALEAITPPADVPLVIPPPTIGPALIPLLLIP
jgi:RHS repeat-associated protein